MTPKNWFSFIFLSLVWGSSFLWIKIAIGEIGPFTLVAVRLVFGLLVLALIVIWQRPAWPRSPALWGALIFMGLINTALPFVLISWGEKTIDSAVAAILNGAVPLFTLVMAHFFLHDDRMTWFKSLGVLSGFAGVVILMSQGLSPEGIQAGFLGQLAVLAASAFYAIAVVYSRRKLKGVAPLVQGFASALFADLMIWGGVVQWEWPLALPTLPLTWVSLAALGVFSTGIAYAIYFYLIHSIGPTRTSMVTYVAPVVGVVLGVTFLNEPLTWQLALGTAFIASAVWVVNLPPRATVRAERTMSQKM